MLGDWYGDDDTPSQVFDNFRLSEPSARVFDAVASHVGAVVAGRTTYEHSSHWGGGSPPPDGPTLRRKPSTGAGDYRAANAY